MIAVLDACVLYPPAVRDILMWLAVVGVYEPRWTDDIHEEWMRSVLSDRPDLTREQLERTRHLMDEVHPLCLVTGYESRIPGLVLPDENDRHVLAAAIRAGAEVIVTFNLSDFPPATLARLDIVAQHPDDHDPHHPPVHDGRTLGPASDTTPGRDPDLRERPSDAVRSRYRAARRHSSRLTPSRRPMPRLSAHGRPLQRNQLADTVPQT